MLSSLLREVLAVRLDIALVHEPASTAGAPAATGPAVTSAASVNTR
jgi:hypothetical protein